MLLLLGGPGQLSINVFHNKTCIRSAMESVIEIAGGAPRGLGRSLLGGDLALGIGSIPLVIGKLANWLKGSGSVL